MCIVFIAGMYLLEVCARHYRYVLTVQVCIVFIAGMYLLEVCARYYRYVLAVSPGAG